MLEIIRDELEIEISLQKILERKYELRGRKYPMYDLSFKYAKRILLRESKIVRYKVIEYLEKLEEQLRLMEMSLKERKIEEWNQIRLGGKEVRRIETDAIKDLIEVAIK